MNDTTRKRIERQLAEKVLGATFVRNSDGTVLESTQILWNYRTEGWTLSPAEESWCSKPWSPLTNFTDAGSLVWRLVEKRGEGSAEVVFDNALDGDVVARVIIGGKRGFGCATTDAEALTLAICEVVGISAEDDNGI